MEDLNIEDKRRFVYRRMLSIEVKKFNAMVCAVNGNDENYAMAFSTIYEDIYGKKVDLNYLSSIELRRMGYVLYYAASILKEEIEKLKSQYMDYSIKLHPDTIQKCIHTATKRAELLYRFDLDKTVCKDIKPIIKKINEDLKLLVPIKSKFTVEPKSVKEEKLRRAYEQYICYYKDVMYVLERQKITDKKEINQLIGVLNQSFFGTSIASTMLEVNTFFDQNIPQNVFGDDYLRANALKFKTAHSYINKLDKPTFNQLLTAFDTAGLMARTTVQDNTGNLPEQFDGFVNSFMLAYKFEKTQKYGRIEEPELTCEDKEALFI